LLGSSGNFDGVAVIDVILAHPVTASTSPARSTAISCARTFLRSWRKALGAKLRDANYQIAPLLETIFLSREFYSPASIGTRIKPPVELWCRLTGKWG